VKVDGQEADLAQDEVLASLSLSLLIGLSVFPSLFTCILSLAHADLASWCGDDISWKTAQILEILITRCGV